jgi:hypothetical protein
MKALVRLYEGSSKALVRLYKGVTLSVFILSPKWCAAGVTVQIMAVREFPP